MIAKFHQRSSLRARPARPFGKSHRARGSAASRYRTQERREAASTESSYYEYDAANQLTQVHDLPADTWNYFAYDTRGNCLRALDTSGSAYFAWTSADLVDKIRWADGKSNYFYYDARLRRFGMRDSDGLRYFTWDSGGMNLIAERNGAKAQTAAYAHGQTPIPGIGSTVAVKKTEVSTTYYQYPVYDHRGSVVRLLDGAGAVKAYYEYDAFGRPLREEVIGKSAPNRLRWQTNWDCLKDSNGWLYDSLVRVYNAKTGRFLNRNPWGFVQGRFNLYDAMGGNPVRWNEPRSWIEDGSAEVEFSDGSRMLLKDYMEVLKAGQTTKAIPRRVFYEKGTRYVLWVVVQAEIERRTLISKPPKTPPKDVEHEIQAGLPNTKGTPWHNPCEPADAVITWPEVMLKLASAGKVDAVIWMLGPGTSVLAPQGNKVDADELCKVKVLFRWADELRPWLKDLDIPATWEIQRDGRVVGSGLLKGDR